MIGLAAAAALTVAVAAMPVAATAAGWERFEIILWHDHGPAALHAASRLGVTAGRALGLRHDPPEPSLTSALAVAAAWPRAAGLGFYVENIGTDFYAAYHRWRPDRPLTWAFDLARARHAADPTDPAAFIRDPGLSDPAALARVTARLAAHARALGSAPLYYDLGDETGIADLTAAWDFDLSPMSLAAMRDWLRGQYGTLAALNAEWGTGFAAWDAVRPLPTDRALEVADGNFAAWWDFKDWMDEAFARAVRAGTQAVHAGDGHARAGLEGAQVPGWGGYDYTRLARAVDVMEITDQEQARAIAQAMNPALITLVTLSGSDAPARRALWRAVLGGARGAILWDPDGQIVGADGAPGPDGRALASLFAELAGPVGAALLASTPHLDPVGNLYSPGSFRVQWLLDRQRDAAMGLRWTDRTSETELADNPWRAATRQTAEGLAHLGLSPRWLSPEMLAQGGLSGLRALFLPHALALSDAELAAIRAFAAQGGLVLADDVAGAFDGHGHRRAAPPLSGIATPPPAAGAALEARLAAAGVTPFARLDGPADATLTLRQAGGALLLAIRRDADETPAPVTLALPAAMRVTDLRTGVAQRTARLTLTPDPVTPTLLRLEP